MSASTPSVPGVGGARGQPPTPRAGAVPIVLALAVALASVVGATSIRRSADAREGESRTLRIETQRLERRLRRLDAPDADATLAALRESRDGLRVRLVEALDGIRERRRGSTFTHRIDVLGAGGEGDGIATLRLVMEGRVAHGAALLELLEAVETARRPWPGETRGCVVQRVEAGRDAATTGATAPPLLFRCAVDLSHWSEPETSR